MTPFTRTHAGRFVFRLTMKNPAAMRTLRFAACLLVLSMITGCASIAARSEDGASPFAGMRNMFSDSYQTLNAPDLGIFNPAICDVAASLALDIVLLPYDLSFGD
ncbi:MAG: hypothetical protein ACXWKG_02335 [Limisphaerales bacterium]